MSNKLNDYSKGLKKGAAIESFETAMSKVVNPFSAAIKPLIQKANPNLDFLDPVVDRALKLAIFNTLAELVELSGHGAHKIDKFNMTKEEALAKTSTWARAARAYSGEAIGDELGQLSVSMIPMVKNLLSNAQVLEDMQNDSSDDGSSEA